MCISQLVGTGASAASPYGSAFLTLQFLHVVAGVDYLTEYRFLGGRLEYSCDLCDVELKSATEVADHVTSTRHHLQYLVRSPISLLIYF